MVESEATEFVNCSTELFPIYWWDQEMGWFDIGISKRENSTEKIVQGIGLSGKGCNIGILYAENSTIDSIVN